MKGMKVERAILVAFLGNYLVNNVVAAFVAMIPASQGGGTLTPQYIVFVLAAAVLVGIITWWYMCHTPKNDGLKRGIFFGVLGFVVAVVTAFVSGISGVLLQTGSLSQVASVLPNFWPFLANWSTLVLLGYWVVPAAAVGYYMQMKSGGMGAGMGMSHDAQ